MKRFFLRIPIFLWLVILTVLDIFLFHPLFPAIHGRTSLIPVVFLSTASIHIPDRVTDSKGAYQPVKHLWLYTVGCLVLLTGLGLILHHSTLVLLSTGLQIILAGTGYRFIERYAIYRYHYLHSRNDN